MSEGPVSFGKPLMWLVIVGCAGGGYYAATHWPATYDGAGYSVSFPHGWVTTPANDPTDNTMVVANGPLPKLSTGDEQSGVAWCKVAYHGTIDMPAFMAAHIPGTTDWTEMIDVDYKKAELFMYEDNVTRYYGVGVDRGDAVIICAIGCPKANFNGNKLQFEKVVRSLKCQR
jgi:hypothetical protein